LGIKCLADVTTFSDVPTTAKSLVPTGVRAIFHENSFPVSSP